MTTLTIKETLKMPKSIFEDWYSLTLALMEIYKEKIQKNQILDFLDFREMDENQLNDDIIWSVKKAKKMSKNLFHNL